MSFTTGQLIFASLFVLAFVILIARAYRLDRKYLTRHYKRSWMVLAGIVLIFALLWILVRYLSTRD